MTKQQLDYANDLWTRIEKAREMVNGIGAVFPEFRREYEDALHNLENEFETL